MTKTLTHFIAFTFIAVTAVSCQQSIEKQLTGTWKVTDVQTNFDETKVTPEMLRQVVDMQKKTYFRILNDTTMIIISNNLTHEARWHFNKETSEIIYSFTGMRNMSNTLGKYEGNSIINKSTTPLGVIITTYEKE
ncbi:MAG: hypothetical protein GXO86_09670 [Chlorobi bacterium]|nr:hypothetical protein [Chlorobiota bacterium]